MSSVIINGGGTTIEGLTFDWEWVEEMAAINDVGYERLRTLVGKACIDGNEGTIMADSFISEMVDRYVPIMAKNALEYLNCKHPPATSFGRPRGKGKRMKDWQK